MCPIFHMSTTPIYRDTFFGISMCHQMVTHIGSVTRDQKVPGSNHVWVGSCGVDIYQLCLTGLTKAWWCANMCMVACT